MLIVLICIEPYCKSATTYRGCAQTLTEHVQGPAGLGAVREARSRLQSARPGPGGLCTGRAGHPRPGRRPGGAGRVRTPHACRLGSSQCLAVALTGELDRAGPGRRYDAKGFSAGSVRVEGAAMCTGGLLTQWRGVRSLADVTEDSLALLYTVKPAPGVRHAWSTRASHLCVLPWLQRWQGSASRLPAPVPLLAPWPPSS